MIQISQGNNLYLGKNQLVILITILFLAVNHAYSEEDPMRADNLVLKIIPISERFCCGDEVLILVTFKNLDDQGKKLKLPYLFDHPWDHLFKVFHNAKLVQPTKFSDYAFTTSIIPPKFALTILTGMKCFFSDIKRSKGKYYIYSSGIENSNKAHAIFSVEANGMTGKSVLSQQMNISEQDWNSGKRVWKSLLENPSNPLNVAVLHFLDSKILDNESLYKLVRKTKDIGVMRECIRLLSKANRTKEVEEFILEIGKMATDIPLRYMCEDFFIKHQDDEENS